MRQRVIVDTGPLVALLAARDHRHDWTRQRLAEIAPPLITCEAVISETCFLSLTVVGFEVETL
jgi:predicted nucleic acid-binding protein